MLKFYNREKETYCSKIVKSSTNDFCCGQVLAKHRYL